MIDFILRPIRRNFGKDRKFYAAIDDMFGFIPNNIELYKLALIHKSASVTLDDGRQINNERLEFLGDAVIESVTSDYLFIEFPDQNEGFLTQLRSKMVSRQSLNEVAKRLNLDAHVITHSSASFSQKHIYGDAFEAMMGAIYLDQGYDFVNRLLINRIFGDYLRAGTLLEEETDFKSRLIEWCQKKHHTIRFITSHDKSYSSAHPVFNCKVLIDDIEAGYGSGDSKKEAEQQAAFSVSQGFREEDCTKLFDKLDAIERNLITKQKHTTPQPRKATETAEATETPDKGTDDKGSEDNAVTVGTASNGSGRGRSARRARRRAAVAEGSEEIDNTTSTDSTTEAVENTNLSEDTEGNNSAEQETRSSESNRSSRRSRNKETVTESATENTDSASTTLEANGETEEAEKADQTTAPQRGTRRRQTKRAKQPDITDTPSQTEAESGNEATADNPADNTNVAESATDNTPAEATSEKATPKRRARRRPSKVAKGDTSDNTANIGVTNTSDTSTASDQPQL